MTPGARREPLIDALRALALLGVLAVNVHAYPHSPWSSPLGVPLPTDSTAALAAHGLIAWWCQGKAYPLLAFLFGVSLALSPATHEARHRRMGRLMWLGVLHGSLLYAGDILTLYAVCGFLLLRQRQARLRVLRRRLWGWLAAALFVVVLSLVAPAAPAAYDDYATVGGWGSHVMLSASAYLAGLLASLFFFLPEVMLLMTAGLIAGRLGLLTRRRWQRTRQRFAARALPAALLANGAYALAATVHWIDAPAGTEPWIGLVGPLGWWMAAALAAALAAAWHTRRPAALRAIVPLGRYTLSLYVGTSLLCALWIGGAGLGRAPGSVALLGAALGLWGVAAWLARTSQARGWRGPLESWMARTR